MRYLSKAVLAIVILFNFKAGLSQATGKDSVEAAIEKISQHDIYETSYAVGFAGHPSMQFELFKTLVAVASNDQLLELATHHKNAVVRLYCYQALKKRQALIPGYLTEKFRKDETPVETLDGCIGATRKVNSLINEDIFGPFEVEWKGQAKN